MNGMILVSACLMGERVRYDGAMVQVHPQLKEWNEAGRVIPFCPEVAGGLDVPRIPAEITGGDGFSVLCGKAWVQRRDGYDVTANFIEGAMKIYGILEKYPVLFAVLKDGSPSCGSSYIYDGSFTKTRIIGKGVAAALLEQRGIQAYSEKQLELLNRV